MDLNALLRLVFLEKNDITFGVLTGLLLTTLIWLLVRSVMDEKSESASTSSKASVDKAVIGEAIEGALKKAIGEGMVAPGGVSGGVSGGNASGSHGELSTDAKELKKTLHEREAKISALMSDLEAVKSQIDKSSSGGAGQAGGVGAGLNTDTSGLHAKIKELQTKLAEYEIIEDDIADLSIYKEENKKLKEEVERLRATVETAKVQVQAAQVATDPAPLVDKVQAAQAAVVGAPAEKSAAAEKPAAAVPPQPLRPMPEPFKLDPDDDVMGEFAQALAGETPKPQLESSLISGTGAEVADPKAALEELLSAPTEKVEEPSDPFGELDTEKMLAEVASLKEAASGADSSSVLDEQLDTDRLMAEMGMAEAPAAPPVQTKSAPVAEVVENDIPVDDLLAEFKDTDLLKETKGT